MTALDDSTVNKLNDSIKPKNEDKSQEPKANATVAKYEAEADEKSTVNKEKLKKKPPVKPVGTKKTNWRPVQQGRNNKNKNNKQRQQAPQAPVTKRKERELPEKITFYESLTVMELGKNFTVNLLKSLKSSLCLVLWQQSTKLWIKMQLN